VHVFHPRDLRALLLRRVPQIVGELHTQPRLSRATKRGGQPDCKLGADRGMPIDHARQRDARDLEALGKLGDGNATIGAQHGVL
jgi:hypothetical protein